MKSRMAEELYKQTKNNNLYQPKNPQKISVDYEKIYLEKPLLMQGNYTEKDYHLGWETIF